MPQNENNDVSKDFPTLLPLEWKYHLKLPSFSQDILPSDGPDTTKGSSLFGTRSPLPSVSASEAKPKASPIKAEANESDSEATETESEWEKERAQKKAQKDEELEKVRNSANFEQNFGC